MMPRLIASFSTTMPSWLKKILGGRSQEAEGPVDLFPEGSPEFQENPYPFYSVLREKEPFYRTAEGAWILSRYADIKAALDHPSLGNAPSRFSTFHKSKADRFVCASLANHIMPFLDGPAHKEQRRMIARIFQKEVKAFAPRLEELAREAVEKLPREFQVISGFAHSFAIHMICELLGITADPRLREWSSSFFYLFTKIPSAAVRSEVDAHLTEFRDWVRGEFARSEKSGVLAGLAEVVAAGEVSEEIAIDTVILLFADGLENVDSGIGNALFAFSRNPDEWSKLRKDPGLVKSAVDECLRFESPAQYIARTCLEDFEWQGHQFKKDISVILLLASANRDESAFMDAGVFRIDREAKSHLAFGQGKHSCLGGKLVEMELAAILDALREKCEGVELVGGIQWQSRTGHRWMEDAKFRLR